MLTTPQKYLDWISGAGYARLTAFMDDMQKAHGCMAVIRSMLLITVCALLSGCSNRNNAEDIPSVAPNTTAISTNVTAEAPLVEAPNIEAPITEAPIDTPEAPSICLIHTDGMVVKERFLPPAGFSRLEGEKGSFAAFLQALPVKPDGSKVMYFDGREKARDVYMAVVDYTLGDRDLQQCADAVMRLRAEYLYASNRQDEISFHFVNGFTANFSKWADGYGVRVDGNDVSWIANSRNDATYESFQRYLDIVYAYSSTLSLEKELVPKDIEDMAIGDVFIVGGSPGHCIMVVDMAVNEVTGEKAFIVAQSYMPAQDIQILKGSEEGSPWYSGFIEDKLITPEWIFETTQLKTWN